MRRREDLIATAEPLIKPKQTPPERAPKPDPSPRTDIEDVQAKDRLQRFQWHLNETASLLYEAHVYPHMQSVPSTEYIRGCEPCEGWAAAKAVLDE